MILKKNNRKARIQNQNKNISDSDPAKKKILDSNPFFKSFRYNVQTMVFLFLNFLDKRQEGWEDTELKKKARSLHF